MSTYKSSHLLKYAIVAAVSIVSTVAAIHAINQYKVRGSSKSTIGNKGIVDVNEHEKKRRITILFGTVTGTSQRLSHKLKAMIQALGMNIDVTVVNVKDYDEDRYLDQEDILLFLCSTWTDGAPPVTATRFIEYLNEISCDFRYAKDHLQKLSFAVFGLGGAVYEENFCKPVKIVHDYFTQLGGNPLLYPMLGDDSSDLEGKFSAWSQALLDILHPARHSHMIISNKSNSNRIVRASNDTVKLKSKQQQRQANNNTSTVKRGNYFQEQQKKVNDEKYNNVSTKASTATNSTCCNSNKDTAHSHSEEGGCCNDADSNNDDNDEEEEDRINSKYVTMDLASDDDDDGNQEEHEGMIDLEDLGNSRNSTEVASREGQEMVTKLQRRALTKEGYRIIGTHSAVKLCRWTKNQMRGRGGCYKHTMYGITSYQCMEATPSLACANKCVFCWRHHKNPVGTDWRWKTDDPAFIVDEAVELHRSMINEMKGVPGVLPERLKEAYNVKHCALSLVGEPIMYPRINEMLRELHNRGISSYLVTNAQFPEHIKQLDPVTQLYVSVDASTRDSLKAIDRPLFKDFWERFLSCLKEMKEKKQRTVYRMTLVKSWNMEEVEGYAELVELGQPDFIEIKAVTYCGKSDASSLTMQNVPWHADVCKYGENLASRLNDRAIAPRYSIAAEHQHSCCIILAREDKYLIDDKWHTWIDYEKFNVLIQEYYASNGTKTFSSIDYLAPTPEWALYQSVTRGFDPEEQRWRKEKNAGVYKPSDSGCG